MKEVIAVTAKHVEQWTEAVKTIEKITLQYDEPLVKQALAVAYNFALTELIRARAIFQELEKKL